MAKSTLLLTFSIFITLPVFCQDSLTYTHQDTLNIVGHDSILTTDRALSEDPTSNNNPITLPDPVPTATLDSVATEKVKPFNPSFQFDYGKGITYLIGYEQKLEGGVNFLILDRYEVIGELGYATLSPRESYTNGLYEAEGMYYRFGAGYSIPYPNKSTRLGLSVRYGISRFEDRGTVKIQSNTIGGTYSNPFTGLNLESRWWEIVLSSEKLLAFKKDDPDSKLNHLISLGFFARMRFLVTYDDRSPIDVYSIPGYGKSIDKRALAFNLFLKIWPF